MPLSIDDVVDAALRVTARSSLDALTIRAVADELGVTSPAVYHYVASKGALVERVCERVTQRADLTVETEASWDDQLVSIMIELHEAFVRYPGVGTRALSITGRSPASAGIAATMHSIILQAGFPRDTANELVAALHFLFSGWLVGKTPELEPSVELSPRLLARTTRRLLAGYAALPDGPLGVDDHVN